MNFMISVNSTKPVRYENAQGSQSLLAEMADTQFVDTTDSVHVWQKQLAGMADLTELEPSQLGARHLRPAQTVLFALLERLYIDCRGPAASPGLP